MLNKPLLVNPVTQSTAVVTQSTEAVKALLAFVGRASDPLPTFVELDGGVRLTRSKKGDAYYTTTPTDCSCKARTYNPGTPCEHMKALQAGNGVDASRAQARAYQARQRELRANRSSLRPVESIRPEGKWPGGRNGPVDPDEIKAEAAKASSSLSAIDCHDTTDKEAAYWSIQADKDLWPAEA